MKNKIGKFFMGIGTVLVLAALFLFLWNRREDKQAEQEARNVMPKLIQEIAEREERKKQQMLEMEAWEAEDDREEEMAVVEIDGYGYIGYLTLPTLGTELPVMAEWDYPRLQIAPCRYAGSTKTDDLVIAAHNYASHFGSLSSLSIGDTIYFRDMDGEQTAYSVKELETLQPTDIEEMTGSEYDLTLFTCTYGGQSRVTVRCMRKA